MIESLNREDLDAWKRDCWVLYETRIIGHASVRISVNLIGEYRVQKVWCDPELRKVLYIGSDFDRANAAWMAAGGEALREMPQ